MSIVNFFYKGEKYKIERSLLNKYTDYFSKSNLQENETVNLVTEFDLNYEEEISKDNINEFIGFFEKEGNIKLTKSNVFPIKKLSTKYEIITLTALTDEYIKQHTKELIIY